MGFKLPKSAYEHEAWWSNNATGHSHARAWLKFGWRTEAVDLARAQSHFSAFYRSTASSDTVAVKRDPWGCMAGTVTFMPGVDLTAADWRQVERARKGRLLHE